MARCISWPRGTCDGYASCWHRVSSVWRRCTRRDSDSSGQRSYHLIWHLAHRGTLVLGPTRDGQQMFVLCDHWLPPSHSIARDDALAQLARRYFSGHGPATAADLTRWANPTLPPERDINVFANRNGVPARTILHKGQVIATWTRPRRGSGDAVELTPLVSAPAALMTRAAAKAAEIADMN